MMKSKIAIMPISFIKRRKKIISARDHLLNIPNLFSAIYIFYVTMRNFVAHGGEFIESRSCCANLRNLFIRQTMTVNFESQVEHGHSNHPWRFDVACNSYWLGLFA